MVWPPGLGPEVLDLFTDGACAVPHDPKFRFASWALSLVLPGDNPMANQIVGAGHVVGHHQTAYRGECQAVLAAFQLCLSFGGQVRIWCDNQAVVGKANRLLKGGKVRVNHSHADVWGRIADYIGSYDLESRVSVIKVVSHCDWHYARSPVEEWAFRHNALVDAAATQVNFQRPQGFWDDWFAMVQEVSFHRQLHKAILQVLLRIGRCGKLGHDNEDFQAEPKSQSRGASRADDGGPQVLPASPTKWINPCKLQRQYGVSNLVAVHQWWQRVGIKALGTGDRLRWISGLQLYADFWLEIGHPGPISISKRWLVDNTDAPANLCVVQKTTMFLRVWWSYLKANSFRVPRQLARPCSGTIVFSSQCYRLPWDEGRLDRIDQMLLQVKHRQLLSPAELTDLQYFPRSNVAE